MTVDIVAVWGHAANGDVVEVVVAEELVGRLLERWPPLGLDRRGPGSDPPAARFGLSNEALIIPGHGELGDCPSPGAWNRLESELALFAAQRLNDVVAVHAAVIERHGSAMVLPAQSGAGKSMLAAAAATAGGRVLSDEYALIDPIGGLTTGWRRAVRIRHGDRLERLDIAVASPPLRVGLVALVAYSAGSPFEWERVSPAEATLQILANTLCARTRPDASLDAALAVARTAPTISVSRGEAAEAIGKLLNLMDEVGAASSKSETLDSTL